jgi:hypothetical protein
MWFFHSSVKVEIFPNPSLWARPQRWVFSYLKLHLLAEITRGLTFENIKIYN